MTPFMRGFVVGLQQLGAVLVVTPFNWSALKAEWNRLQAKL